MMRQAIHRDLDLSRHGLLLVPYLGTISFGDGDERLFAYHNADAAHLELKRHSPHDADAMHRLQADLTRYSQLIRKTLMRTPPEPTSFRPKDIREFLFLAKQFWSLGEKEIYEYIRFFTISAADFLEDYFENELIKAAMASPGIIGTALGVHSPGSAYILLHHVMGDVDGNIGAWGLARGGMGAISSALAGAVRVQTAREDQDPDDEEPPGRADPAARPARHGPRHGEQPERMDEMVADAGLEHREQVRSESLAECVCAESAEGHREKQEDAPETYPQHDAECSPTRRPHARSGARGTGTGDDCGSGAARERLGHERRPRLGADGRSAFRRGALQADAARLRQRGLPG
jgi:hypothetical protein